MCIRCIIRYNYIANNYDYNIETGNVCSSSLSPEAIILLCNEFQTKDPIERNLASDDTRSSSFEFEGWNLEISICLRESNIHDKNRIFMLLAM